MISNKYIKLFLLLFLTIGLLNCSGFLDKDPENVQAPENIDYTNTSLMFQPVSGIYATVGTARGFGSWPGLGVTAIRGDDVDKGSAPNDQVEFNYAKTFRYNIVRSFFALNNTWTSLYNIVIRSNYALDDLDQFALHLQTDSQRKLNKQYNAEVRFLRAYAFFYIARLWGDAPLLLDNDLIHPNSKVRPSKVSRDLLYAFINNELDTCIKYLPALRPNEMPFPGQVTKYTALALKAKANSDLNKWDEVEMATDRIIEDDRFELYDEFYQLFKLPGKLCNESLFELQYTDFGQPSGESIQPDNWFVFQGPRSAIAPIRGSMNGGWGFLTPSQKLLDLFKSRGEEGKPRYITTFLFTNSITPDGDTIKKGTPGEPTMYSGKAYLPSTQLTPGRVDYGTNNNIRMLRYADVLLLNAEAKVRNGKNGDTPFNLVRSRAGMDEITDVTLDEILEERFVEFACEWGERFYDLVRTGKATTELPGFVSGKSDFYPIPLNQIDLNPNLK